MSPATRPAPYPISEEQELRARKPVPDEAASPLKTPNAETPVRKRDALLGPTQRSAVASGASDPEGRSLTRLLLMILALAGATCVCVAWLTDESLPQLVIDVVTLRRGPWSAQDNAAAAIATMFSLLPLVAVDFTLCAWLCRDAGSRWFLLHSLGNLFLAALCVPDLLATIANAPAALSVEYCRSLGALGCTDWPTCIIISMHLYHMLAFKLDANDLFHHLLFVPTIGGINFVYPLGTLCNVLCFFISGLPGGLDYLMLAAVKAGKLPAYTEKRLNCSINTWLRGPGITTFCALDVACWARPLPGTPPEDVMPWYVHWPILAIVFFNGQYYAQRVIGNYYIRKAQDHAKRGISRVDLHAS